MHCESVKNTVTNRFLYLVLERSVHGRSMEEGEVNNKRRGEEGGKNGEDKIEEEEEEEK